MSVVGWLDCEGVSLQATPSFSLPRALRHVPQLDNEALLAKLKVGCSVRDISDALYSSHPETALRAIFRLDGMLCLRQLQLCFGTSKATLGHVRLCGMLRRSPLQRQSLADDKKYVLSRFAYQHRVDSETVLDCPLSNIRCVIASELLARTLYRANQKPQNPATLLALTQDDDERQALAELLGVLVQCGVLETLSAEQEVYTRADESLSQQAQWDFHDLLFHVESVMGYNTETDAGHSFGECFPYKGRFEQTHAQHPPYEGDNIALPEADSEQLPSMSLTEVLQRRKSIKDYDVDNHITKAELGTFLTLVMRGKAKTRVAICGDGLDVVACTARNYPSGGSLYEQEIYAAIWRCHDIARGFYHYDPFTHSMTRIATPDNSWRTYIEHRQQQQPAGRQADILFMFGARYQRISWKYSRVSYAIVLKNIGTLYQTMYLVATYMGLAPCGHGGGSHRALAELSGQDPWQEGLAGEFTLGRPAAELRR